MVKRKQENNSLNSTILKGIAASGIAAMAVASFAGSASAESLLERIKNGETIRLGFSNEPPGAYPGANGEPLGVLNEMTLDVLEKMGTTKIEPIVTEWGSLVPGLQAGRFDIITAGMWIKPERCRNVLFSQPIAAEKGALLVPKGNPEGLHSYQDVRDKALTLVTGAGYTAIQDAQKVGISDDKIMQVAGPPEIAQAVKAGRAAAGALDYFTATGLVKKDHSVELADSFTAPANYPAVAFPLNQQAAVDAFNAALKEYIGSDEMMVVFGKYGYGRANLPDGSKTADLCKG
ncbi:ectoine/hydroxyectoine ABC transporter substrate-binding protein EhuB [Mesorhizobium sp.]|uniref:ectoine/hydroxyectoine ABC transporter substrate-binding protein EhuB n=1 Tax=Mesorhizobium sp. TaxID=1871066 RepID=UPI0025D18CB8|nr:ectoine/hydroxyectoine ABC transporter substrate-binding protein EhuB [Mesorhizobium sp.]